MSRILGPEIVRSEAHALRTTPALRDDVARTIDFYRYVVRLLATVAQTHWDEIGPLDAQARPMALEALIHPTSKRSIVRYPSLTRVLGKMPSYLRRAALSHALGVVSSFLSNYSNWQSDTERERGSKPPRLGFSNVFPSLYGGNMIHVGVQPVARAAQEQAKADKNTKKRAKFEAGFIGPRQFVDPGAPPAPKKVWVSQVSAAEKALPGGQVRLKLLGETGLWTFSAPLTLQGKRKRLPADGSMALSPSLMQRGSKVWLGCPVALKPPRYLTNKEFKTYSGEDTGFKNRVCAVDVGINTAATVAIVDFEGTVIARKFLTCARHNDQRDHLQRVISYKQSLSGGTIKGEPFCSDLYRRIEGVSKDAARLLASEVAEFAQAHQATVLVIEDLKGWRPKGHSHTQRPRFHRFQHRMLVQSLTHKAQELGMRLLEVHARGTSRWAYDGSGAVVRSRGNAQLAKFANGRQYNADLNGAYNIAARGLAMLLGLKNPREKEVDQATGAVRDPLEQEAETGKSPGSVTRMPLVLADIWACRPALRGASNPPTRVLCA